ncbi:hypothetical protein BKA67DRAFT_663152 [Truncatella angustata]|uniref:Uncharacterized protein n=1 Tax=Truncatella angustata TaxID=152316 RepID=A0A9P8RNK9_9PEZI|nr:uncharacterized protein BKA67DRAFT_663152 [Truncatella angustata]KAH6646755.1 hypothetical protein BKA67DRAFT_663152 [Truncatella angustata]
MAIKKLRRTDNQVAWICPVSDLELLPSPLMLDEEHDASDYDTAYDDNVYTCCAMAGHNVPDDPTENVRLGDVIVGSPEDGGPACIYYDLG